MTKKQLERKLKQVYRAWRGCSGFLGTFEDGPASLTPDRKGVTVSDSPGAFDALSKFGSVMRTLRKLDI